MAGDTHIDWTQRIRLRHLQLLASLAETRNVSQSAKLFHMTQPALSKWLKDFEDNIGLPLFKRQARGLRPTSYCEALLDHTRRIGIELDRARDEMASLREGSTGYVIIGGSGATTVWPVASAVHALLKLMPAARVDVVDAEMDRLIEMLSRRELDIAVGRSSPQYLDASIASEELHAEPIHFVARADHPLHDRGSVDWDDLYRYRWVLPHKGAPVRTALKEGLQRVGRDIPFDVLQSNSVFASLSLLAGGDLLTVVSHNFIARYEKQGVLKRLPVPLNTLSLVSMYWRRETLHSKAVNLALRCLREISSRGNAQV